MGIPINHENDWVLFATIKTWDVPQTNCLNCHDATYGSGDVTPPVTT